jgi:hypothetical protein
MHLVRGMSTVNTRKRKTKKLTLTQIAKFEQDMRAHNKKMRQIQAHDLQMNLQEYIDYCHGKYTPKAQKSVEGNDFKALKSVESYQRTTPDIPSYGSMTGNAFRKEPNKYTGTLIKGIATMHKSNAVPIIDKKQAEEISQMRRN